MSGRNRGPPIPIKGGLHEPPFRGRGLGPMPHPALLDEPQFGRGAGGPRPGTLIPHPAAIFEDRLALQHQDIQALLIDNQRLAATHVALKQEVEAAQHEIKRMAHVAASAQTEMDLQLREAFEKVMKLEADLRASDAMRAEVMQVRADIQQLTAARQELTSQAEGLSQDLNRANMDLQQVPLLKGEIEGMRQELQRARAAIEYEKKGYAENYEHGQAMEKNLIAMAREMEKLRAELANAEKRARAAAAVGNQIYGGSYGNPETGYGGNPYTAGYGMNPGQGSAEGVPQYGPGPGSWGTYDMQRAHGHR